MCVVISADADKRHGQGTNKKMLSFTNNREIH